MRPILRLALYNVVTVLRERQTLFWFVMFPLLLFSLLTLVFGRLGQEGTMNFTVALVNEDQAGSEGFGAQLDKMFDPLATPRKPGDEPLFTLKRPAPGEPPEQFLAEVQEAARLGRLHVVVRIPPQFTAQLTQALSSSPSPEPSAWIEVFYRKGDAAASMAAGVIEQIMTGLNVGILASSGAFRDEQAVGFQLAYAGGAKEKVQYVDYLLPGILLMAFFTGGLFGVPGTILYARDGKILRRYWVTPLGVPQYLGGFALGYLAQCALQFGLIVGVGKLGFAARINFGTPLALAYLMLAALTFLAFGFLVSSLVKTASAGMALANILNLPMMFVSSLFFPVADLPRVMQVIVSINPLSYLADGLRAALGVGQAMYARGLSFLVPLAWLVVCVAVAAWRLRWDVER